MRVLIVGAGIDGLSLASLLAKRGLNPTVNEKTASLAEVGYMLGLFPIGANVLRSIDVYEDYLNSSVAGATYEAYNLQAHLLKEFSFASIVEQYGPYQLISRYELLELIKKTIPDLGIRFNTQIQNLSQNAH